MYINKHKIEVIDYIDDTIFHLIENSNTNYLNSKSWILSSWLKIYQQKSDLIKSIIIGNEAKESKTFSFIHTSETIFGKKFPIWKLIGDRGPLYSPHREQNVNEFYSILFNYIQNNNFKGIVKLYFWEQDLKHILQYLLNNNLYFFCYEHKTYPYLNTQQKELHNKNLSNNPPYNLRRKLKKILELGEVTVTLEPSENYEYFLEKYIQFNVKKWEGKGKSSKYQDLKNEKYLKTVVFHALENKALRIHTLKVNKDIAAIHIGFQIQDIFYYYYPAYNPKFSNFSPGLILLYHMLLELCEEDKIRIFDMGAGVLDYKMRFTNTINNSHVLYFTKSKFQFIIFRLFNELIPKFWNSLPESKKVQIRKIIKKKFITL